MKLTKKQLFNKVETIAKEVKKELRDQGYVVPVKERDGSINFDGVKVRKVKDTFYAVYDRKNRLLVKELNSLQSAIILANKVALGKPLDDAIIEADRKYGFQSFKLEIAESRLKKAPLHSEAWFYYDMRRQTAKEHVKQHLEVIQRSYKKLSNLR